MPSGGNQHNGELVTKLSQTGVTLQQVRFVEPSEISIQSRRVAVLESFQTFLRDEDFHKSREKGIGEVCLVSRANIKYAISAPYTETISD